MNTKKFLKILCILLCIVITGCGVSLPPEAPELSTELGEQLIKLETSHKALLDRFFELKEKEIDRFVEEEWLLVFAQEFFSDGRMQSYWNTIVAEDNKPQRLEFLLNTTPKLQKQINDKKKELKTPLKMQKNRLENSITEAYGQAYAMNATITSFLTSASKVVENRNRLINLLEKKLELELQGEEDDYWKAINDIDIFVSELVTYSDQVAETGDQVKSVEQATKEFLEKMNALNKKE